MPLLHEPLLHASLRPWLLRLPLCGALVLLPAAATPAAPAAGAGLAAPVSEEEFIGPFSSWADAVRDDAAVGDGRHDDTGALQAALDRLGSAGQAVTLYLPPGTYRITRTLTLYRKAYVRIVGADPLQVRLRWDGPAGGTMVQVSNSWRVGIGRIRFDGAQRAGVGLRLRWDRRQPDFFPTHTEIADSLFQDLTVGVQGGEDPAVTGYQDTAAEVSIKRSRFLRADSGILLRDWNTLDWWVSECLFEDNGVGVRNTIGSVHVYHSIFRRSREADVFASDIPYMSLRDNFSSGSRRFFTTSGPSIHGIELTLQRNTIVGSKDTPITMAWAGTTLLLDNRIEFPGPALRFQARVPGNLVSVGNRFTATPSYRAEGAALRRRSVDDETVARIEVQEPPVPAFARRFDAPVLEVDANGGAALQAAIQAAEQRFHGQRPVIHLPQGLYRIAEPIVIPAGADLRLVGDGFLRRSVLELRPGAPGPTLRFDGPSRAQLIDLDVHGGRTQVAIELRGADAPGAHLLLEQPEINDTIQEIGIDFDGLEHLALEGRAALIASDRIGVRVTGGRQAAAPGTADRDRAPAEVDIFGGQGTCTGRHGPNWAVRHGGRLLVQDHWFEHASGRPVTLTLEDGGQVTFHGGLQHSFRGDPAADLNLLLDSASARVSFLGVKALGQHLSIAGAHPSQDFLFLGGCLCPQDADNVSRLVDRSTAGRTAVLYSSTQADPQAAHALAENRGAEDDAFLLQMLAQTRSAHWHRFGAAPPDVADIRFYRVSIESAATGLRIRP